MDSTPTAPDFVLVHGAFSDATAWADVVQRLEAAGARATAFDLPAHGDADGDAGATTLAQYVATVRAQVERSTHPVVLVGHSLAGMVVAQVAEAIPERVAALVFCCAFLPENGRSAMSYASTDATSRFGATFAADPARGVGTMTVDALLEAVFNETEPIAARASAEAGARRPEPLEPFGATVTLTPERFGTVERYYLATERDRAVTPDLQRAMLAATPCREVFSLPADHVPMASAPARLVEALLAVRARLGAGATAV